MGLVLEVLAEPSPELVQGHPAPVPVVEELVLQPPVEALGCVPNVVARSPERGCGDRLCDDLPKAHAENGFLDRCLMRLRGGWIGADRSKQQYSVSFSPCDEFVKCCPPRCHVDSRDRR